MVDEASVKKAQEHFGELLRKQMVRIDRMKLNKDPVDLSKLKKIVIGVCGGDGIGPYICNSARIVMEHLLADRIKSGNIEVRTIDGLTIERRVEVMKAIPDDTLEEL
ncbi:MAG: isocitrate/isopropylmalate dehydrogenase family protein, partial [Methanomassiliicoccaceae archaeon]|nr:isocitrate/isopropylmalate dehydrogenase family protein [Methanomassiliicoccaceae archaeon]